MSTDVKDSNAKEKAEVLKKRCAGPLTEREIAFLRDVQGLVDFALRNGLSFPRVISMLRQDVNEIARHQFDLEETKADGFLPQVTGYSKFTSDSFGDSEEEEIPAGNSI